MKKTLLLLVAATATATAGLDAAVLTPEAALSRALAAGASAAKAPAGAMAADDAAAPQLTLTRTAADGAAAVYLFAKGSGGYLAVAADDVATPLLGYSDSGVLPTDPAAMPPALLYWLDEYANEIAWARANGTPAALLASRAATADGSDRASIAPLLATRWNQSSPYNDLCPVLNETRCPTGCVATAMAQVMNYHKWPVKGTGSSSYEWTNGGTTLSADYGSTTYDWANMTNTYSSASTDAEKTAVATLMLHCGISSQMSYNATSSGAQYVNTQMALVEHFDYNPDIHMIYRPCYTISEWNDSLYRQLATYGPVLYQGFNDNGGHAFVCDGYSSDNYFHFNWGWGGSSDGYFLLDALNPSSQGIGSSIGGYNKSQSIIADVKKNEGETPRLHMVCSGFSSPVESASLGETIEFKTGIYNYCASTVSGYIGLLAVNNATNATSLLSYIRVNLDSRYGLSTIDFTIPTSVADGVYTLMLGAATNADEDVVAVPRYLNRVTTITMTVADGTATFSNIAAPTVKATNLSVPANLYSNMAVPATATFTNQSATDSYYGEIRGYIFNSSTGATVGYGSTMTIELGPGESREFSYVSTYADSDGAAIAAGSYLFAFVADNATIISDAVTVTLGEASFTLTLAATPTVVESPVYPSGFTVKATVNCTAGYYYGPLICMLWYAPGDGKMYSKASFSSDYMTLNASDSAALTFNCSYPDAIIGGTYVLTIRDSNGTFVKTASGSYTTRFVFDQDPLDGIADVGEDAAAPAATEFFTLSGCAAATAAPDGTGLAPGVYIKVERMADGATRTSKVFVR